MRRLVKTIFILCLMASAHFTSAIAAEKWAGVDESVVEKYAKEQGREAREPLINTDQGDLLLFVFLIAGAAGGFAAGYYWRVLITGKSDPRMQEGRRSRTDAIGKEVQR